MDRTSEALVQIEQFGKSLVLWDRVIRHDRMTTAYFNRALSCLELTWNQRSWKSTGIQLPGAADSNLAIDLADQPISDFYTPFAP
jgi:hypothetical protein